MRAVESTFPNELTRSVNVLGVRQTRLQTQAATGQRIRNPEDDPSAFRNVLELQGSLQQLGQYSSNIQKLQDRSAASYDAIAQLKRVNDRANEIATAAVSIRNPDEYAAFASEVNQLIESALGLANTRLHGESLFSASSGSPTAFQATRDAEGDIQRVAYAGNEGIRNAEIAQGITVRMDILGANSSADSGPRGLLLDQRAGIDVFGHLLALRDALRLGDTSAITSAAEGLAKDETGYIQSFAEIGADQGRLESAGRQSDAMAVSLNQLISQESDVDLAQTLVELNQLQAAYSAALQSAGKILRLSLLDYV